MESEKLRIIFSDNLRYWLSYRGKTQADLYKMAGVSSATASDWCNGKKIPRADKLVDIARWLMIELTDLLTDTRNEYDNLDSAFYRLKNDEDFKDIVIDLMSLDYEQYQKVKDYISLLKK